jgi:hypothetical protein
VRSLSCTPALQADAEKFLEKLSDRKTNFIVRIHTRLSSHLGTITCPLVQFRKKRLQQSKISELAVSQMRQNGRFMGKSVSRRLDSFPSNLDEGSSSLGEKEPVCQTAKQKAEHGTNGSWDPCRVDNV